MADILISDSPKFAAPRADNETTEHYRAQMRGLFGDCNLPPVVYKRETVKSRQL